MGMIQLWWSGLVAPRDAFDQLQTKPAPEWGFWVVLSFNIAISLFTLLPLSLLGQGPQMESVLTFLPTEEYLQAEMLFLPVVRVALWLLQGGIVHLGVRLSGLESDYDQILNIGGLANLVVMPPLMISDWVLIGLGLYRVELTAITHGGAALWGAFLSVVGLKRILGVKTWLGLGLSILSTAVGIVVLSIFAR